MDEWEIREDERKKIREDLTRAYYERGGNSGGFNWATADGVVRKRSEVGPPAKVIKPIQGFLLDRKIGPNDELWCGKINELVHAVNDINFIIRTVKA